MEQILGINIKDVAALIAAIVAILGLIITSILTIIKRKDELTESQLSQFQNVSNSIAGEAIALRSVGLQNISHYLYDKRFSETTRKILTNNILFEKNRHLQAQSLDILISCEKNLRSTLTDLIDLNRLTWNLIIKLFMNVKKDKNKDIEDDYDQLLQTLEITKLGISEILKRNTFVDIDLSKTRLDGCNLQDVLLNNFDLSGSTFSYANLKSTKFIDCNLSLSIFAGAYMENSQIIQSQIFKTIFYRCRIDGAKFDNNLSEEIKKQNETRSEKHIICFERELDWQGIWITKSDRLLDANWYSDMGTKPVHGDIEIQDKKVIRTNCSDGNNGEYKIETNVFLDTLKRYSLIIGTRTLRRGVPSSWYSIKWKFMN